MKERQEHIIQLVRDLQLDNEKALLKRLLGTNNNDKLNYKATINEIIIGHKLKQKGFKIAYEKDFNGLKPDWFIEKNNQQFIVEVKSLNMTRKDINKHEFQTKLMKSIESIERNIYVKIIFEKEYFDFGKIDIEKIRNDFKDWLDYNCQINQIFKTDNIIFKITKTDTNINHICVFLHGGGIDIDERRLFSSSTLNKSTKYKDIVRNFQVPFILAIFNQPLNGIETEDLTKLLYGPWIYDITFEIDYSKMSGIFYDSDYKDLITGVYWIEHENSDLKYFHNYYHDKELKRLLE